MTYNVFGGTLNPTILLLIILTSLYLVEPGGIGPLPGGLTNYCPSVL